MAFLRSFRGGCLVGLLVCAGLMGYALYAQYGQGLNPCPLCIFQRVGVIGLGLAFLLGAIWGPRHGGRWVTLILGGVSGLFGLGIAGRHLWIQSLPSDQIPACGPGLGYLLDAFPLSKALHIVLTGSGECAKVERVLGLPMPAWTLAWFMVLLIGLIGLCRRAR